METTTTTTIKPELISGFELTFEKDKDGNYKYSYPAVLTVKIGNAAKEFRFLETSRYHSSEYSTAPDGTRTLVKESYDEPIVGVTESSVADYKELGIAIDTTELDEMYKKALTHIKELKRKADLEAFDAAFEKSWIHRGEKEVLSSKKRPNEMTVVKSEKGTLDSHTGRRILTLTYKNSTATLSFENVSTGRYSRSEMRYGLNGSVIAGYRTKYYRTIDMAVAKFKSFVDEKLAVEQAKLSRAEKEELERKEKSAKFEKLFGLEVSYTTDKKWYRDHRGRSYGDGYMETTYWLHYNGKKYRVADAYRNSEKEVPTFTLGGFNELTAEKVVAIIKILGE